MSEVAPICRALMLEIERWRLALNLPMEKFCEYAGLPDRYYPKALHADSSSGRQPQWGTVQVMLDAIFPGGFDLELKPRAGVLTADNLKARLLQLRATINPHTQRDLMRERGRAGGIASATVRRDKAAQRRANRERARHAASIRWEKKKRHGKHAKSEDFRL